MSGLVSDGDLARARQDLDFRHRLVADNLEMLLGELNRLRTRTSGDQQCAVMVREGVDLAVKLAELLQRVDVARASARRN